LGLQISVRELGCDLGQVLLEALDLLLPPRVARARRKRDAARSNRERHTAIHLLHQLDLPQASGEPRHRTVDALEVKLPTARRRSLMDSRYQSQNSFHAKPYAALIES